MKLRISAGSSIPALNHNPTPPLPQITLQSHFHPHPDPDSPPPWELHYLFICMEFDRKLYLQSWRPGSRRRSADGLDLFDVLDRDGSPRQALSQRSLHEWVQIAIEHLGRRTRDVTRAKVL